MNPKAFFYSVVQRQQLQCKEDVLLPRLTSQTKPAPDYPSDSFDSSALVRYEFKALFRMQHRTVLTPSPISTCSSVSLQLDCNETAVHCLCYFSIKSKNTFLSENIHNSYYLFRYSWKLPFHRIFWIISLVISIPEISNSFNKIIY